MEMPTLIYCAEGNKRFVTIAKEYGFEIGAQMPRTVYSDDLYFIDVNPKKLPQQPVYVARLRKYRPVMASVHDWDEERRLPEILLRAEEIAQYTERVLIIPKVPDGIKKLPRVINGKPVVLGYSVPTSHGATPVDIEEFAGWPVHILGGSPQKQIELYRQMHQFAEVVSIDGNMHQLMATTKCAFFDPEKATKRHYWPTLQDYDGQKWGDGSATADAPYEAFRRSCENIMKMWRD